MRLEKPNALSALLKSYKRFAISVLLLLHLSWHSYNYKFIACILDDQISINSTRLFNFQACSTQTISSLTTSRHSLSRWNTLCSYSICFLWLRPTRHHLIYRAIATRVHSCCLDKPLGKFSWILMNFYQLDYYPALYFRYKIDLNSVV